MAPSNGDGRHKGTRSEMCMEYGFAAVAFAIFFFAIISTLTKSAHESGAHDQSETPAASHH